MNVFQEIGLYCCGGLLIVAADALDKAYRSEHEAHNRLDQISTERDDLRRQLNELISFTKELANSTQRTEARLIEVEDELSKWHERAHGWEARAARYEEALEEISSSTKWAQDTASKREIKRLQDIAAEALSPQEV